MSWCLLQRNYAIMLHDWLYTGPLLVWDTWYCTAASASRSASRIIYYCYYSSRHHDIRGHVQYCKRWKLEYITKNVFQLPPITLLLMPSYVMMSITTTVCYYASQIVSCYSYYTTLIYSMYVVHIFLGHGIHSLPGLGPHPYARKPKRTNRGPAVPLPSAFGPHY